MIDGQTTIFEMLYPTYKITKKIRMITFFSGYDSQCLAMKYLGVDYEHYKTCEWAVKSIQALKDIHFEEDTKDYSKDLEIGQIKEFLFNKGISSNYNEPMTREQINRLNEKQARTIYNNIQSTHNLVNIQQVKGKDLEIVDTDKYDYILTYSFPCQDISGAGLRKGFEDASTRSGMLWEVERILTECKELGTLPSVLLMENVPLVHGTENLQSWNKWQLRLEELGYKNYWQDLIATDYGIPQTRNRTFMVSILGDYNYTFPKPIPLKLKLKDMLEDNVDEKYYLSDKMINFFTHNEKKQKEKGNGFSFNVSDGNVIAKTITTRAGSRMDDNFIINKHLRETLEQRKKTIKDGSYIDAYNRTIRNDNLSSTISTRVSAENDTYIAIKNATKQGYLEATDGDGIDLAQPNSETRRGRVQKDAIQTLTTQNNLGVVSDLRIRKLTPRECFRLMGVKDEDFEKVAKNQSDSSLYHLAGDSIVCQCLEAIFKEMIE